MSDFSELLVESIQKHQPYLLMEDTPMTRGELKDVERYADALFNHLGIDIDFSRHFFDRVNDPRNGKQVTPNELVRMFNLQYQRNGPTLKKGRIPSEALMKDMKTDINIPFAFKPTNQGGMEMMIRGMTLMRKKNFKSPDRAYTVM